MSTTDPNPPKESTPSSLTLAEGDKLAGCYALARRLTVGDGAEVWLAHDEVLGKDVSLHFVPDAVRKDPRALQELRLDIKRNRQLIHPNILRVYDLVEESDWVAISMETFEGEPIELKFAGQGGKGSKPAEIQAWVEQLAHTLEEAHRINVLHRDLTPANLFLTPAGKLLVANFGISRTIRDALARTGDAKAAVSAYESPQLLDGKPPARTDDVYSLGAILLTALAGQPPFAGENIAQQIRAGVPAGTLAVLQKQELGIPVNWQTTIVACLGKNPEARPQTAADVARRLAVESAVPVVVPSPAAAKIPVVESAPKSAPIIIEPVKSIPEKVVASKTAEPAVVELKKEPEVLKKEPEISKSVIAAPPSSAPKRPPLTDFIPRLYPEESRFPVTGLAAAAAVIVIIAIIYHFATSGKQTPGTTTDQPPEKTELRALTNSTPTVAEASPAPATSAPGDAETTSPKGPTPSPAMTSAVSATAKAIAEKTAVLEKAKLSAQAAEKTYADLLSQQQMADAGVVEVQKSLEEKSKAAEPLKKAAEEAAAQRKKLEAEQKAADAAAIEAQKVAAEKTRLAEESAKALSELEKKNLEKMTAPQQVEAEITTLQKTLAEKQRIAVERAKATLEAEAAKQQQLAMVTDQEREIERIKSSDMETQRQQEAAEAERRKLEQEMAEMQRAFKERMKDLEEKQKQLKNPGATSASINPLPVSAAMPQPVVQPVVTTPTTASALPSKIGTPEPIKLANIPASPAPLSPTAILPTGVSGGGNSLGMKFVRVGDVDFCVWQARVKDFEVFAKAVNLKSTSWKGPGFKQGPDHPVVNVSWQEAIAFCKWLTDKEHKDNVLSANQFYRLPTDLEWSKAVGLPEESGKTPEMRDMGVQDVYPWGTQWPPPQGAGNYTGEETGSDVAIKGYDDGFAWTAPVGSFPPNKLGIYDMGGNVWQWCMDGWNAESKAKVLRGASWYNGALKLSLLSSCRVHAAPDSSTDNYGFRVVRASEAPKVGKK